MTGGFQSLRDYSAPDHPIWVKSNNSRRRYSDLKIETLGAVHHLGFDRKLIYKIWRFSGSTPAEHS